MTIIYDPFITQTSPKGNTFHFSGITPRRNERGYLTDYDEVDLKYEDGTIKRFLCKNQKPIREL